MAIVQTVDQVFDEMERNYRGDEAQGLDSTYQFHITGDDGGDWHAHIAWENCEIGRGTIDDPDVTINMTSNDWLALASGKLNPETAYMTGKLKVEGDLGLATKLSSRQADMTRSRVLVLTSRPFNTFDTVTRDSPLSRATSSIVGMQKS